MLKILHTADFHIGANFSSLAKNSQQRALDLHFFAISSMVKYANQNDIDAILIAGDTFDSHVVDFQIRTKLVCILSEFKGKIYIVCGNHDYYFKGSFWDHTELSQNITLIKTNDWQKMELEKFTLFAASFTNIYEKIDLSEIIVDENRINIALVHADILSNSQYNPISKQNILNSNLDYLAIGHNHGFSEVLKAHSTYYAAPGNISATGFDENSKKGFIVATFDDDRKSFEFIPSDGLEILNYALDISNFSNLTEIHHNLSKISAKNIYLDLNLIGIDNFGIDAYILNRTISEDFFAVNIQNSTEKPENLWRFIDEDNLLGEFTRLMRVRYEKGADIREILKALKLGIDALTF